MATMSAGGLPAKLDSFKAVIERDEKSCVYSDLQELICSLDSRQTWHEFSRILPLSLSLLDHHHVSNKLLGLKCVRHIIHSIGLNDMKPRGVDSLLLHSLKLSLYLDDCLFMDELLDVMLLSLNNFRSDDPTFEEKVDEIIDVLLNRILMTSSLDKKLVFWKHLPDYFEYLGLASVKYTKPVLSLLEDQLSFPLTSVSNQLFIHVFKSFNQFLKSSWPRVSNHISTYVLMIVKFLYTNHADIRDHPQVLNEITLCTDCLRKCDASQYEHMNLILMEDLDVDERFRVKDCLELCKMLK